MVNATVTLAGKRVVVVGGSSGIGFAVASIAQELGATLVIASSQVEKVDAAIHRLPGATGALLNMRDESSIISFLKAQDPFDHLVMTAGEFDKRVFASTEDIDLGFAREALELRFFGSLALIKHGRSKLAADGSITLTSGMLAHRPHKGSPYPTAVAGALEHLVRGFAVDLAPQRINGVCPGLTRTEMIPQISAGITAATAGLPLARAATPVEAALAYIYLMLNGYVTGQVLPVDGGGLLV